MVLGLTYLKEGDRVKIINRIAVTSDGKQHFAQNLDEMEVMIKMSCAEERPPTRARVLGKTVTTNHRPKTVSRELIPTKFFKNYFCNYPEFQASNPDSRVKEANILTIISIKSMNRGDIIYLESFNLSVPKPNISHIFVKVSLNNEYYELPIYFFEPA